MRTHIIIITLLISFLFGGWIIYEKTSRVGECYILESDCKKLCFQIRKPERGIPLGIMLYIFQLRSDPYMIDMGVLCDNDSINLISCNYAVHNSFGELVIEEAIYDDSTITKITKFFTPVKRKIELPVLSKKFHGDSLYLNFEGKFLGKNGDTSTLKLEDLFLEPTKFNGFGRLF